MPDRNPKAERARADDKLRLELIDTALMEAAAPPLAHGAEKYGVRNWRINPIYWRTYIGALRRHVNALADGEDIDPDSGFLHLGHIVANANVLLDAQKHGTLVDDRSYAEELDGDGNVVVTYDEGEGEEPHQCPVIADPGSYIGRMASAYNDEWSGSADAYDVALDHAHPNCGTDECCGKCEPAQAECWVEGKRGDV